MPLSENGFDAGWRNIGRLALWSIPYMLGAAALIWLGFAIGARDFFNQLSQERRRAIYVGAAERPTGKLKIETPNQGCLKITRVDLDGSTAAVYFQSACQSKAWAIEIHWQLVSPDGTNLSSGYAHSQYAGGPEELLYGEKAEVVLSNRSWSVSGITLDNRASSIRFWFTNY